MHIIRVLHSNMSINNALPANTIYSSAGYSILRKLIWSTKSWTPCTQGFNTDSRPLHRYWPSGSKSSIMGFNLFRSFGLIAPKYLNYLVFIDFGLALHDEDYSSNTVCALNLKCIFLFHNSTMTNILAWSVIVVKGSNINFTQCWKYRPGGSSII